MFIPYCLAFNFKIQITYKSASRLVEKHNKHENVINIWDEPIKKVQP